MSDRESAIVHIATVVPLAEEMDRRVDPTEPEVGRWYAVTTGDKPWLACVTHVGSNYVKLVGLNEDGHQLEQRVHHDEVLDVCAFVADPDAIIAGHIAMHQQRVTVLMDEVKAVTMRLGVGQSAMLSDGGDVQALTLRRDEPMDGYTKSLVKAKDETLPELFKKVREEHEHLATWMKAKLIPLRAQSDQLKPTIKAVEDRIYAVQLYAGLCEEIKTIKKGEPAPMTEKIHLFQRRAYMDEECLAAYETGGMDINGLGDFDKWLAKPKNLSRLLPYPRSIIAFKVRRHKKYREIKTLGGLWAAMDLERLDELTFLYIRNGQQLHRLSTDVDFGAQLFPDMDHNDLTGTLYAHVMEGAKASVVHLVTEHLRLDMIEREREALAEYKRKIIENNRKPKKDRDPWLERDEPHKASETYRIFDKSNVYYDDIRVHIQKQIADHNRIVLILQGVLDRSTALHPHPPYVLWNNDSFRQALTLVYDDARALTPGDAPDFEAYRARLNASITAGTVTLGQERVWKQRREKKRSEYGTRDKRRYYDNGDRGPGKFTRVAKVGARGDKLVFEWVRTREFWNRDGDKQQSKYACTMKVERDALFNVDAYTPGDFHQFFDDPRTREQYLQWAWLLIEAEEYKAGNRELTEHEARPPKREYTPGGSYEYRERKRKLAIVGQAVRLTRDVHMKSGTIYKKGTLWRVTHLVRGEFYIDGINLDGSYSKDDRGVHGMSERSFEIDPAIPAEPKRPK